MDSPPPLFTAGQEIATFLVSYGILSKAWGFLQSNTERIILEKDKDEGIASVVFPSFLPSNTERIILEEDKDEGIAYVVFPSFHNVDDFVVKESEYGEGNIQTDNKVFSDCLKGNDDKPALVHQGALKLFLHILKNTDFEAKLKIYTDGMEKKVKPIIFVGHFLGGAVATLATLWVLEKRLRKSSPFCITFGCPLVGDERLVEAIAREHWGGNFCHVVSKNDIVPRMVLAPIQSIVKPLTAVFPYWQGILPYSFVQDDCRTLLEHVMKYSCPAPSQGLEPRSVLDGKRSPYRPFGTYMLCSSHGAACIENSETVLKLLHWTMQGQEKHSDDIVMACILEHTDYGSALEHLTQNSTLGRRIENCNSDSYMMGISLQLQAIDVEAQNVENAETDLQKAGIAEHNKYINVANLAINLSVAQCSMAELEWYKERCEKEDSITYYDSFKKQTDDQDFRANVYRVKLLSFWEDILKKWERNELPSDFQTQNKWINAGNTYRRLVEPLDIAYYYRTSSNYLSHGRHNRHKVLQKWMEEKEKTRSSRCQRPRTKPASLTEDSCFWAHVEEAWKDLEHLKQGQGQQESLEKLEKFEDYVTKMENDLSISPDVFFQRSRFMMWWEEWKEYNKNQSPDWSSPLCQKMENLNASLGDSVMSSGARKTYKRNQWSPPSKSSSPTNNLTIDGFTVGQETAAFLASCEILSKAWAESQLANNSERFAVKDHGSFVYVAFPSFHKIESFTFKVNKYGEGNIQTDNKVFSDSLKGNDDKPALVHQGALKLFLDIMEKTDFQAQLQIYMDSKQRKLKPIIFVGHSLGGAVATLATLWVLEKRLRQSSPFCITFGCPLVGDEGLVKAVGRENWGGNFLHVISQHDIVPRMLLAPVESIAEPLIAVLPYWHGKVAEFSIQDACKTLLKNVLQYTATVAYHGVDSKRSPYKPFGTYMFCSSHGAACIENSETVLKMLHWTMPSHEQLSDNIVQDCFSEHIGYGYVLKHVIENSISGKRFANTDSNSSYEIGILVQLEAIGFEAQNDHAQLALRKAGETEKRYSTNVDRLAIDLSLKQSTMAELEWYKESCEKDGSIGYYDTFKNQDVRDIHADRHRRKLAGFWDEIIEKWEGHELPSDFESQNKWINAGNTYRKLVEPLDIAFYYRNNSNGNYLSDGRQNRHKVLQKWMEAKEKARGSRGQRTRTKRASLTPDSCFWAHVEEAWKDLENLKQGQCQQESLQKLEKFEKYVTKMENDLSISRDVFFKGSSFMMWWEEWKEYKKNQSPDWSSPLCQKMENLQVT